MSDMCRACVLLLVLLFVWGLGFFFLVDLGVMFVVSFAEHFLICLKGVLIWLFFS